MKLRFKKKKRIIVIAAHEKVWESTLVNCLAKISFLLLFPSLSHTLMHILIFRTFILFKSSYYKQGSHLPSSLYHLFFFWDGVSLCHPGWSAMACSWLIANPGSSDSPASASLIDGITEMCHHAWLILIFLLEMGLYHVDQAGLQLLTSGDPPILASQSTGITGMSHRAWPGVFVLVTYAPSLLLCGGFLWFMSY